MGSMAAQLLFPFLLPSLFIRLLIFAQGERKKKFFVSNHLGSVVTPNSARPIVEKSFHNFAFKCRSHPKKQLRLPHSRLIIERRSSCWASCPMSLGSQQQPRFINSSLLNHGAGAWTRQAIITHFVSCSLSALARSARDRSVGVGVKMNENKYFWKWKSSVLWAAKTDLAHLNVYIYVLPTRYFPLSRIYHSWKRSRSTK